METTRERVFEQSAGHTLRATREERGLTVEDVAARTKVPAKFLSLIEDDAFPQLPPDVYTTIYIKAYCSMLDIEAGPLVDHFRSQRAVHERHVTKERRHPFAGISAAELVVAPRLIRTAVIAIAAVGVAVYVGFQMTKIVTPPNIAMISPTDGTVTAGHAITVEGRTDREVSLTVNGKPVAVDDKGGFSDTFVLQGGLNVIQVVGTKKYSKPMTVTRRVIVNEQRHSGDDAADIVAPPGVEQVVE